MATSGRLRVGGRKKKKKAGYWERPGVATLPSFWARRVEMFEEERVMLAKEKELSSPPVEEPGHVAVRSHGHLCRRVGVDNTLQDVLALVRFTQQRDEQAQADGVVDEPVAAVVNGRVCDLQSPLSLACSLASVSASDSDSDEVVVDVQFVDAWHPAGLSVLWHSAAHVLGQAMEFVLHSDPQLLGEEAPADKVAALAMPWLCDGPALDADGPAGGGFYYDAFWAADAKATASLTASEAVLKRINKTAQLIAKEKQPFERLQVSRHMALDMFHYNPFKQHILREVIAPDEPVTLYRCGPFVDLCRGPHVPHTGVIKSFDVLRSSSALWQPEGVDAKHHKSVQRIYGIAFPDKGGVREWKRLRAEAAKRDHRALGKKHKLFYFNDVSPGSAFFLPHGTRVYNRLVDHIRAEYAKRGYDEVRTPLLYHNDLWKQSGHWEHYRDNMFLVTGGAAGADKGCEHHDDHGRESSEFGLKPMNCPGHCVLYAAHSHSYRDLPIRMADFSPLHRNELSGALSGLTRVRRFAQDDAHIFCTPSQVEDEIRNSLAFVRDTYELFGFDFSLKLSTRPDEFVGDVELWNEAEDALRSALDDFCGEMQCEWELNPADGAFYGPKVDVTVRDALRRQHQCATIQLDFQLPRRFDLKYVDANGEMRTPVMIHRAILGSVERMMAILLEHYGGKWPLWLSPRQVIVCPVSGDAHSAAANEIAERLRSETGLFVDVGAGTTTLNKAIRSAQLDQYNYILVVGDEEIATSTVNVRTRDNVVHGTVSVDDLVSRLVDEVATKSITSTFAHSD